MAVQLPADSQRRIRPFPVPRRDPQISDAGTSRNTCSPSAPRKHDDRDVADQLVTSHLRLVAKIAMGDRGYGSPISEVVSEGNVGLMQAVKRFEPEKGLSIANYAMWWIKVPS